MPVFRFKNGMTVKKGDLLAEVVAKDDWAKVKEKGEALNRLASGIVRVHAGAKSSLSEDAEEQWKLTLADWNLACGEIKTAKVLAPCSGNTYFGYAIRSGRSGRGGRGGVSLAEATPELDAGAVIGTIATSDSMDVTFNIDERAVLAHRRMSSRKPNWELALPVVFGLADEKGFPYRGKVTHVAPDIDPNTHVQSWLAVVPNPNGIFMPGMSVRVRVITSDRHKVMLVPNSTAFNDLAYNENGVVNSALIYIVSNQNRIESRRVPIARKLDDYLVLKDSLDANDWIALAPSGERSVSTNGMVVWNYNAGETVKPDRVTTPPPAWAAVSVPPSVTVAHPIAREVTDFVEFVGRIEAAQTVELRALVTGTLDKVNFKPGQNVKQGDVLFEIDSRLYKAELDKAAAAVKQAQIHLDQKTRDFERFKELLKRMAVSREEYDHAVTDRDEAAAAVKTAEAAMNVAKVRLSYTSIAAPFSGKIGRPLLDVGNIVTAEKTVLARLDSTDPVHLAFDIDEGTVLALRRAPAKFSPSVFCGLSGETGFPHEAKLDSVDSRVDEKTGRIRCRAVLPNKDELFVPGMFARVRLALNPPHKALLVPEHVQDRAHRYVFVVTNQSTVERRDISVGPLQDDGMRPVYKGLAADDWVVMSDVDEPKPGMTVTPVKTEMPAK
jgi:RND family efflux transporter MFP subunit